MRPNKLVVIALLCMTVPGIAGCRKPSEPIPTAHAREVEDPIPVQTVEMPKVEAKYHPDPNEPSINELQRAAIKYCEVSPDKIINWRHQAAVRALMPEVSVGYNNDVDDTISTATSQGRTNFWIGPQDCSSGWDFTAKWDLGDLVYNTAQTSIDTRSKLMVELRNEVLDALNTAYFERKKIQRQLSRITETDSPAYADRETRIDELTATIDGLTGGFLSRRLGKD